MAMADSYPLRGGLSTESSSDVPGVMRVSINLLGESDSPRIGGEDPAHVQALAEVDEKLPPILVHRRTMGVIDGMHRLRAAELRGEETIEVEFVDCDDTDVFIRGVEANTTHGLPLSSRDRKAAAARIATERPNWSDRAIARIAGISPKTVAAVRHRSTEETPQSNARVGRDGRTRPLDGSTKRATAENLIRGNPHASLREVAKSAGISVSTAHDVRRRMKNGGVTDQPQQEDDMHSSHKNGQDGRCPKLPHRDTVRPQIEAATATLMNDPSLKFSQNGRILLRVLAVHAMVPEYWERLIETVPSHCRNTIADLASAYAQTWQEVSVELRKRQMDAG